MGRCGVTGGAMAYVKLKYVLRDVDRHGRVRHYFRKRGQRKILLRGDPGSEEFARDYRAALAGAVAPKAEQGRAVDPRSIRWLCTQYYGSGEYRRLDGRTQHVRRLILDKFCDAHGEKPFALIEARHVRRQRDDRADHPEAANSLVKALRQVFGYAVKMDMMRDNPAAKVEYFASGSEGHHSWTLDDVCRFEECHPIGSKARLALALLLYTGQRRSDVVVFGRQHVKDGWLLFTQTKNRARKPITLEIPVIPALQAVIAATPSPGLTFLETAHGRPFTANGFGNRFRKWCDQAGLPHCSAHGLRKAAAARLAEIGCSEHEIMAITGHQTLKEVVRYTRAARRKGLAESGMAKLVAGQAGSKSAQPEGGISETVCKRGEK